MPMYGQEEVEKTFDKDFLAPELVQAQWAELTELKRVIAEISRNIGKAIDLLDIGIGNARVPYDLSRIREMWDMIGSYHGIDNSAESLEEGRKLIVQEHLDNKVTTELLDATELDKSDKKYDLVVITWFTLGNFYPEGFDFDGYPNSGRLDLTEHSKLSRILKNAYDCLNPGGEIVIGSCYKDTDSTRKKQEDFYKKCGWGIITDEKDCFTATDSGWWSQRFTEESLQRYMPFVPEENITFIALDPYDYALQVRIKK